MQPSAIFIWTLWLMCNCTIGLKHHRRGSNDTDTDSTNPSLNGINSKEFIPVSSRRRLSNESSALATSIGINNATNVCPKWLYEYAAFHAEYVGNKDIKSLTYVVNQFDPGLGDRMRMIVFGFRLAAASRRVFHVDFNHPVQLDSVFQHNKIDWRPNHLHRTGIINKNCFSGINFSPNSSDPRHINYGTLSCHAHAHSPLPGVPIDIQELYVVDPSLNSTDLSCIFQFLFKVSPALDSAISTERKKLFNDTSSYVAAQLRSGNLRGEDFYIPDAHSGNRFNNLLGALYCLERWSPLPKLLVTDDRVIRHALKLNLFRGVKGPSLEEAFHTQAKVGKDEHFGTFVEIGLLSQSSCLVRTKSGYGDIAQWLRSNISCTRFVGVPLVGIGSTNEYECFQELSNVSAMFYTSDAHVAENYDALIREDDHSSTSNTSTIVPQSWSSWLMSYAIFHFANRHIISSRRLTFIYHEDVNIFEQIDSIIWLFRLAACTDRIFQILVPSNVTAVAGALSSHVIDWTYYSGNSSMEMIDAADIVRNNSYHSKTKHLFYGSFPRGDDWDATSPLPSNVDIARNHDIANGNKVNISEIFSFLFRPSKGLSAAVDYQIQSILLNFPHGKRSMSNQTFVSAYISIGNISSPNHGDYFIKLFNDLHSIQRFDSGDYAAPKVLISHDRNFRFVAAKLNLLGGHFMDKSLVMDDSSGTNKLQVPVMNKTHYNQHINFFRLVEIDVLFRSLCIIAIDDTAHLFSSREVPLITWFRVKPPSCLR